MLEIEKKVWDLINPGVEEMQLRLVRVRLSGMGGNPTLQIRRGKRGKPCFRFG